MVLTIERAFATVCGEQMYAAGYGIHPMTSSRHALGARHQGRSVAVTVLAALAGATLAVVAQGGGVVSDTTIVVRPGDTLWSIAAAHYPSDDVRSRVDDIERANALGSPVIEVGETLKLPA